ncbi:SDR family NAD(P)-dependent oxidoreductase [Variovorax sp. KK3]|uniref:SDR family NAD(P)-dependent oxidoreductase n=1 Tax=Variovorax sp. KK3 TaxID=1855728 RepID=UPI0015C3B44C|nr:SDR family oxidoreductase [Variovorax sp. KK3]
MNRFKDKTVIVTGAASGIGRGVAKRFAEEGANLVICDIDQAKLEHAAREFEPESMLALHCDVSNFGQIESVVKEAVKRFEALHVIVNNAGVAPEGSALDVSFDDWNKTIATNLTGVFFGCRAASPELLKTRGCIVNTASVSGLGADWGLCAYNAAKGGVVNLTRSIALDFGRRGVRANSVCPSLTETGMTKDMLEDEALVAKFMERLPLGRVAQPADIAAVVAFLSSDDARFVNGVNMPVDGGVTASNGQPPQE